MPFQEDPLAGYTADWRSRLRQDSAAVDQEDPLADYSPDWRSEAGELAEPSTVPPPGYGLPPTNLEDRPERPERPGIGRRLLDMFTGPVELPPIVDAGPGAVEILEPGEAEARHAAAMARREIPSESQFMRGLKTGLQSARAGVGETLETIGETQDLPGLARLGRAESERARHFQEVQAPDVQRIEDIASLSDFGQWAAFNLGQGLGSTAGPVAGGVAGGLVAGPAGAAAGAALPSYTMLLGEVRGELEDHGVDPGTINKVAPVVAMPAAALETLLPASIGRGMTRGIAARFGRDLATRIATRAAQGAVVEGLTEAGQEAITAGTTAALTPEEFFDQETLSRLVNAALAGALPGGVMGGLGGAVEGRLAPAADPLEGYTPGWREEMPLSAPEEVRTEGVPQQARPPEEPVLPAPGRDITPEELEAQRTAARAPTYQVDDVVRIRRDVQSDVDTDVSLAAGSEVDVYEVNDDGSIEVSWTEADNTFHTAVVQPAELERAGSDLDLEAAGQRGIFPEGAGTAREAPATPGEVRTEPEVPTRLFRGSRDGTPGQFYSADRSVAQVYAGEGGVVTEEAVDIRNPLYAENWLEAKEGLGLERSATMPDLIEAAAAAGHDWLTFNTTNGREWVSTAAPSESAPTTLSEMLVGPAEPTAAEPEVTVRKARIIPQRSPTGGVDIAVEPEVEGVAPEGFPIPAPREGRTLEQEQIQAQRAANLARELQPGDDVIIASGTETLNEHGEPIVIDDGEHAEVLSIDADEGIAEVMTPYGVRDFPLDILRRFGTDEDIEAMGQRTIFDEPVPEPRPVVPEDAAPSSVEALLPEPAPSRPTEERPRSVFRGDEGGDLAARDFPGVFFSPDRETAAEYGAVREWALAPDVQLLDMGSGNDEAVTLLREFGEANDWTVDWSDDGQVEDALEQTAIFPSEAWGEFLREKGFQGHERGENLFVLSEHVPDAVQPTEVQPRELTGPEIMARAKPFDEDPADLQHFTLESTVERGGERYHVIRNTDRETYPEDGDVTVVRASDNEMVAGFDREESWIFAGGEQLPLWRAIQMAERGDDPLGRNVDEIRRVIEEVRGVVTPEEAPESETRPEKARLIPTRREDGGVEIQVEPVEAETERPQLPEPARPQQTTPAVVMKDGTVYTGATPREAMAAAQDEHWTPGETIDDFMTKVDDPTALQRPDGTLVLSDDSPAGRREAEEPAEVVGEIGMAPEVAGELDATLHETLGELKYSAERGDVDAREELRGRLMELEGTAEGLFAEGEVEAADEIQDLVDQYRPAPELEVSEPTSEPTRDTGPRVQTALGDFRQGAAEDDVQALVRAAETALEDPGNAPSNPTELTAWADEVLGKSYEAGDYTLDDVYDAFEGAVNNLVVDLLGPQARAGATDIEQRLRSLRGIENRYFRGRVNTGAMKERQQFSTPLPIAEAATYLAGVRPTDRVLEPSAGTGNLVNALRGMPARVDVNELDPRRAAILRAQRYERVTEQDALRLPLTGRRYNVVITNPPYGSIRKGKYSGFGAAPFNATDISQRFVAAAMQSLVDGGRLVAVLPENTIKGQSTAFRDWLSENHTPVAYIQSPPDSYRSRGVRSGSVILVADKGQREGAPDPLIVEEPTWDEWFDAVSGVDATSPHFRRRGLDPAEDVAAVETAAQEPQEAAEAVEAVEAAPEPQEAAEAPEAAVEGTTEADPVTDAANRIADAVITAIETRGGRDDATQAGEPETAPAGIEEPAPEPARGERDRGDIGPDEPGRGPEPRARDRDERDTDVVAEEAPGDVGEAEGARQEPVVPRVPRRRVEPREGDSPQRRREIEAANDSPVFAPYPVEVEPSRNPHPRLIVETRSMGGMPAPSIDTEFQSPEIQDAWGRDGARGGLSDAQADLALRALTAWKRGHGMLNAADVGVGKTRVAAALIAEAIAQGDTRLLYTTKNQNNVVDAIEEFRNVLTGDPEGELPFTVIEVGDYKDVKAGEADLPQPPGPTVYIAHSYNFAAFHEALRDVSPTVWVADEAHEYKNIAGSNRGMAWADLHGRMIDRGAVKFAYFTATPAVTLDELGYLYGLKEWPIGAFGDWVNRKTGKDTGTTDRAAVREAILNQRAADQEVGETSGITTEDDAAAESGKQPFFRSKRDAFAMRVTPAETEQVMRELKGSGHYVSVDLWRGGIEFDVETIDMLGGSPEAQAMRERYNTAAELARDISMTARKFGRLNKRDKHGGLERSMIQSYMKQLLFELRLPRVLEMADAALDAGNQVVISVHSVGGDSETVVGLSEVDAEAPLNKRLESAINAINTEEVKKEGSGAEATWVELGDIPEALLAREALRERLRDLPPMFDPIRKIEEHFGADRVASITGRVPAGQRTQLMGEFQSGQREVAVISKAGKVGISLHDVNDATRNMLVADYEWSADTFKQELGRVDRTGQRSSPIVTLVASNIAGERKFAATIAARMASLGATSKGSAESTGTDALSQFDMSGDIALNAMKNAVSKMDDADRQYFTGSKFVEFRRQRDGGEEMHPKKRPADADMRSFLLEMLMFPVEVADRVMGLFEQEYEALMTGEVVEKLAARRTARVSGEVLRVTGLADDPPLTLFEVVDDTGKQKAIVQGYVTSYIQAIQHARGTGSGGSFKTRRYVHFTEHGGDLISGLELNTAEARRVLSFFGRHTRTALTPEQVWNDLQLGEKIEVQGPGGDEWLLHPRRDGRIQIKGATITKHQDVLKPLSDVVGFEPKGTFLFVKGDQESLAKFLERYPPVAQMEETEPEPETTARSRARRNPRPTKTPDGRTIGSSEELVKTWVLPKRRGAMVRDWTALADYFKPGEFVPSYGGERDRVVNYRRSGTGFVVDVRDAADPDAPIRSHRTRPTRAEFEETMRERGEWPEGGGPDFRTDPRAGFVVNPFGATERELPGEGSRRHEAERTATHEVSDAVVRAMRRFPQAGKVLYDFYSETLIDAVRDQGPYGGVLAERAERVVSETKRLLGEWDRARADVQGLVSRGRKAQRAVDWLQAPEDGDHPSAIYRRIQRAVEGDIEPDEIPERAREVVEGIRNLNDVTGEEFERIGLLQLRTEVTDGDQFVMDLMGDTAGDEERAFRLFTRAQGGRIFLRSPTPDLQSIYAEPTTELSRNPLFDQYVEMIAAENDMDVEEVGEIIDTIRRQHFKRVHAEIPRVFRNHPTDMWYERGDGSRELVPLLYTHPYQYAGAIVSSSAHRSAFVQEFGQGLQDRELEKVVNEALQGRVNPDDTERLLRSLAGMSQDLSRPPQTAGARALAAPDAPERDLGNWLSYMMRFPRATMLTRASVPNLFEAFGNIQSFGGGLTRFVRAMSRLNPKHYDETRKVLARHGLVQTWVMNATVDRQRFAESLPRIYREWLLRAFPTVPMWRLQEVQGAIMGIVMAEDLRNGRSTGLVRASDTFVLRNILDFTETKTQEIAAGNASEEDYLEVARRFSTRSNTTMLSLPAEESRAAGSRWFHELFPFQRYSQMKLRSFAKLHKGFLEAWKRYRADPSDENLNGMLGGLRTLAQYHVGTAAAGTLTHLFLAMLAGGAAGLQVKLEDFEDDPLKFVLEGWVYAQFGPIWTSLARIWTDRRIDNFWMFSAPASVMKETVEALMGWGDYQFLGPMERAARAGSRVSPGPRAIIDVLTSLGLTESDPQRELAISTYWEWLRDNAPPEARTEWLRAEADTREFRKHMGRAYREIRKEASTRTLERARVHLGRALQVEGKDASSVSMSIRSRRLLSRLDAEQLADLRDAIGSELFQTLQVHDQLLSQWADAVGGSDRGPERPRPPSPPRPPRGPER